MKKVALVLAGLALWACGKNDQSSKGEGSTKTQDSTSQALVESFENELIEFKSVEVDASKGGEYDMGEGIKVIIPNDAFVNTKGEKVVGKVDVKVKKFTNAAQIIGAGIPMEYDSAGVTYNLMTNGMVEVRGSQKNEEVNIAPNKTVSLITEGVDENKSFNYYKLDDKSKKWSHLEKSFAKAEKSFKKQEKVNDTYKFRLKLDLSNFEELKSYNNVVWQYEPTKGSKDPNKNLWIEKTEWENVELKPVDASKLLYKLVFSNEKISFETTVSPVFAKDDKAKVQESFASKDNGSELIMSDKVLNFQMSSFGVYNYDRIYHMSDAKPLIVNFKSSKAEIPQSAKVYMVCKSNRGVISLTNNQKMYVSKQLDFKFLIIIPGSKVGYISKEDFLNQVGNLATANVNVNIYKQKITQMNQLEELIDSF